MSSQLISALRGDEYPAAKVTNLIDFVQASIFVAQQLNNNEVNTHNGIIYYIVRYMNSQRVRFVMLFVGNIFHNTFNKLHENFSIREVEKSNYHRSRSWVRA